MPEYTATVSSDREVLEIPVGLCLTKEHLASALVYLLCGHRPGSPEEMETCHWLGTVDQAGALEVIADNVITYGQADISEHADSVAVERAAREAVERLWPDLR